MKISEVLEYWLDLHKFKELTEYSYVKNYLSEGIPISTSLNRSIIKNYIDVYERILRKDVKDINLELNNRDEVIIRTLIKNNILKNKLSERNNNIETILNM